MRITVVVAFVAAGSIGSASIAAQQPVGGLQLKDNPLGNLFAAQSKASSPRRFLFPTPTPKIDEPARLPQRPTVACGLTMIPGDPNVDPGIRHEVPENGSRFSMRAVDPKICR
jgi:hypothetical protein